MNRPKIVKEIEKQLQKDIEIPKVSNVKDWKTEFLDHKNLILLSLIFLLISSILNYFAGRYVDMAGSAVAKDIILDNIPIINLSFLFVYGASFIFIVLFLYPLLFKISEMHIVISQFSLIVLIRSFFMSLTHLKIPINAVSVILPKYYNLLFFNNDLFFSLHTSIPFLGFLLFRKQKIGVFFLIAAIIMAATVLFMHVHYSIDVFAALFITYGSYRLGEKMFRKVDSTKIEIKKDKKIKIMFK